MSQIVQRAAQRVEALGDFVVGPVPAAREFVAQRTGLGDGRRSHGFGFVVGPCRSTFQFVRGRFQFIACLAVSLMRPGFCGFGALRQPQRMTGGGKRPFQVFRGTDHALVERLCGVLQFGADSIQRGFRVAGGARRLQADIGFGFAHFGRGSLIVLFGIIFHGRTEMALWLFYHRIPGGHVGNQPAPVQIGARSFTQRAVERDRCQHFAGLDICSDSIKFLHYRHHFGVGGEGVIDVGSSALPVEFDSAIGLHLQSLRGGHHGFCRRLLVLLRQFSSRRGQMHAHVIKYRRERGVLILDPVSGRCGRYWRITRLRRTGCERRLCERQQYSAINQFGMGFHEGLLRHRGWADSGTSTDGCTVAIPPALLQCRWS